MSDLSLCQTHLRDSDLEKIGTLKNLKMLDISSNTELTDKGLAALANLPKLKTLRASGCNFTSKCSATLKTLPALKDLKLGTHQFTFKEQHQLEQELPHVRMTYEAQVRL
jgi:Leucine-rich repeat (LRR) protein